MDIIVGVAVYTLLTGIIGGAILAPFIDRHEKACYGRYNCYGPSVFDSLSENQTSRCKEAGVLRSLA